MKGPRFKLGPRELVLGVQCERHGGPGWANHTITVYIGNWDDKTFRSICYQPEEFSPAMQSLFGVGEASGGALLAAITAAYGKRPPC